MQKIRKGDEVIVIAGRSKGQRGNVLKRLDDGRLLVENVNMVKKHQKGNPRSGATGGIIDQEAPIDASNVMIVCQECGPTRIGARFDDEGRKYRVCRKCGSDL